MTFEIEHGVEVPPKKTREKYPWRKLAVGDSFMVPADGDARRRQMTLATLAGCASQRHNMKFVTRQVEGGVRVWRIE